MVSPPQTNPPSSETLDAATPDAATLDAATLDRATSVLTQYFATINSGDFAATAGLFADDGALYPPFDREVVGHMAIATYLATEAQAMRLVPLQTTIEPGEQEQLHGTVTGTVQTNLFSVNVAWDFRLALDLKIQSVKIKLLAALPDLLHLKQQRHQPLEQL